MQANTKLFTLFLAFTASTQAFAGTETHGGGGFLCKDNVLLVDLFEAGLPGEFSPRGLNIVRSNEPSSTQIEKALQKIGVFFSPQLKVEIASQVAQAMKIRVPVPAGASLVPPTDVDGELSPTGCRMVGVASYNDQKGRLLIDEKHYVAMPETDKAALWIHEGIYKFLRDNHGVKDSRLARKLVGFIFSDISSREIKETLPSNISRTQPVLLRGRDKALLLETKAEISPIFFLRVISSCGVLAKIETKGAQAAYEGELFRENQLVRVALESKDPFDFTVNATNMHKIKNCQPQVEYLDLFLRPVGMAPFYFDGDLLITEELRSPAYIRPSNWDHF